MQSVLYDAAGHRRSPVTLPGFHEGRAPRNKGRRYPADPPTVEEIIAVMRRAGSSADGARLRALIVILWRAGLRIGEALDLAETDLDASRGAVLVRRGKGGRRREVGMDGSLGMVAAGVVAGRARLAAGGCAVVCGSRRVRRSALGPIFGSKAAGAHRSAGGCAATVRTTSAASCARGRDGA
jgi:site-specific recombinase XerC